MFKKLMEISKYKPKHICGIAIIIYIFLTLAENN